MNLRKIVISIISLIVWLSLVLTYQTVHAGLIDWLTGGSKTVEIVFEPEVEKTIDSEIDRLSIKYQVASSTIRSIIKCESQMYGNAINHNRLPDGTIWSTDWGLMQINDYYHEKTMTKLGLDIHNQWDSLEYGFLLFKSQGSKPWGASSKCQEQNNTD